jgi:hypothetical protein
MARTSRVLAILGLLWLARVVRPRWQPLLAGAVCTTAGVILRHNPWGAVLLPGLLLLAYSVFVPARPDQDRRRLQHDLAAYSTRAQRRDFTATLDQYPDAITREMRDILARPGTTAEVLRQSRYAELPHSRPASGGKRDMSWTAWANASARSR